MNEKTTELPVIDSIDDFMAFSTDSQSTGALRTLFWANNCAGVSVGVVTFGLALLVTYDVLVRYLLNAPSIWVTEISTYIMGYITFVGAGYGLQNGSHVRVDILTSKAGARTRRFLDATAVLIGIIVMGVLAWESFWFWWLTVKSGERTWGLLSIPLAIPYFFFFLGMAWLLLIQITMVPRIIKGE